MSLMLTKHPVITEGGVVKNIFAGLSEIPVIFKREDIQIISIGENSGNVELLVSGDLTSDINVGQSVYIFSEGVTYTYNLSAEVLSTNFSSPNTTIVLDAVFVEGSSLGYMNYRRNYFVELKIIDPDTDLDVLGFSLTSDGKSNGEITIDLNIANDLNEQKLLFLNDIIKSGAINESRQKVKFKYREVYEGSLNSFTTDSEELIIVYSRSTPNIEELNNAFNIAEAYAGYPFFVDLFHSDLNQIGLVPKINYQVLDINKDSLGLSTVFFSFFNDDFGQLMSIWNSDNFIINANTKFIKFDVIFGALPDYDSDDYSSDYSIT